MTSTEELRRKACELEAYFGPSLELTAQYGESAHHVTDSERLRFRRLDFTYFNLRISSETRSLEDLARSMYFHRCHYIPDHGELLLALTPVELVDKDVLPREVTPPPRRRIDTQILCGATSRHVIICTDTAIIEEDEACMYGQLTLDMMLNTHKAISLFPKYSTCEDCRRIAEATELLINTIYDREIRNVQH